MKHIGLKAAVVIGILFSIVAIGLMVGRASTSLAAATVEIANNTADKIGTELLNIFQTEGQADFVVKFTEQADLTPAFSMKWEARGEYVYNTLKAAAERSQAAAKVILDARSLNYQTFIAGNELYVWSGDLAAASDLAALPEVDLIRETRTYYIDPVKSNPNPLSDINWAGDLLANNLFMTVMAEEPTAPNALAWGIVDAKADQFWTAFGVQGNGIVVANIDTGVQWDHPALDQAYKCGTDPTDPACWEDPGNICGGSMCDNNGHGTHTMGTMVADDDPGLLWQAGMAPDAQWIACKGCETNSCSDYALNTCADWILAPGGNPANRPHIVNNSWGGGTGTCDTWYLPKVNAWRAAGTFPAFSAGNASTCSSLGNPGVYQESFGTTGHSSTRAHYGSMGPAPGGACDPHTPYTKPNISSPAVSVCSTVPGSGWSCGYTGTSMASPHTAGAVALLWSCNPALIGQIPTTFEALQNSADSPPAGACGAPPDGEGNYTSGYGFLNVLQAGVENCGSVDLGYLEGHVYDLVTGDPIAGANVTAAPAPPAENAIDAITDPNGYYTMTLVVGTYDVTAVKSGYAAQTAYGVEIVAGAATTQDFDLEPIGAWTPGPSVAPFQYNRFDGVYDPDDGWIYFPGGRTGGSTHDKSIWRYDPANDVWEDTTCDMLYNAANNTAVYIADDGTGRGEAIYVMGGYDVIAAVNIDDVQRYYPSEAGCVVEDIPTDLYPDNIGGAVVGAGGVAEVNGKVYVFGGWISTGSFSNKTWEFDPLAADGTRWTEITDATLTPARSYIQSATQDGLIYAMGGHYQWTGSDLVPSDVVQVFDPANPVIGWVDLAPMPVASGEGRGFGFDADTLKGVQAPWSGKLYVVGGGDWPDSTAEVMEYDIASDTWNQAFPDLLAARRNHAGVFVPVCTPDPTDGLPAMWVFGGRTTSDEPPFGDPEYFPFPCGDFPDMVLDVPPLEAGLFPNQTTSIDFTLGNIGFGPLDWNLFELSPTIKIVGNPIPIEMEPRGHEVNLDAVPAEGGSVQTETWEPMGPVTLILDDGSAESYLGVNDTVNGIQFLWANRFTPDPSEFPFTLNEIWVVFGGSGVDIGDDIQLIVYEDKDGDGDPSNATVAAVYDETIQNDDGATWNVYTPGSPLTLYGPGDILIGVINRYQDGASGLDYPAGIDADASQGRSWAGWWSTDIAPDPPELPPDVAFDLIDNFGFAGNWMVRGAGETMFDVVDILWLSEDPISGTVEVNDVQTVTVTFDSTGLGAGDYFARLLLTSNDPGDPFVTFPVTLTIFAAGVDIDTTEPAMMGDPGMAVTYTLQVANLGDVEDTFDISVGGNTWMVDVLDPVVTIPSSGVADVEVVVHVPMDAMVGVSDMVTVAATSQGDPTVSDSVDLTTTANLVYGVELTPETAAMMGSPGQRVEYTLSLMNTGNGTDTFDLSTTSNWNVHFPETSVTVSAGASVAVIVHVDIPGDASQGDFDAALITATSQGNPSVEDSSVLTTSAEGFMIYLPIVFK